MDRREFLANVALAGVTLPERGIQEAGKTNGAAKPKPTGKWRGVNLGGWLALEKWITPSVYAGVQAEDEYTLCEVLGKSKAAARLQRHRETWITAEDFRWLAAHGINAVRLPVAWKDFMPAPDSANVILDTHPYQCFTDDDRKRDLHGQVAFALLERRKLLDEMKRQLPCLVGKWSCALPPSSLGGRKGFELDVAVRAYGDAQLINFDAAAGWFFWTYKTEEGGGWSFRDCVHRGWLPGRFDA